MSRNGYGLDRDATIALDNFPIVPALIPEECKNCMGEQEYPSCIIRFKMFPKLRDPLKLLSCCTPLGGGGD